MDERAEDFNDRGVEFYNQNNMAKAREFYEKALAIEPKYADAWYNLGLVFRKEGEDEQAKIRFEKAIEIEPDHYDALTYMGIYHYDRDEFDLAEEFYRKALTANDRAHYVYYDLGLLESRRGNSEKQKEYLEKALSIKPDYVDALNLLGNFWYNRQDYAKAREYYERVLQGDSNYSFAFYNLGLIAENEGALPLAYKYYKRALKADEQYDLARDAMNNVANRMRDENVKYDPEDDKLEIDTKAKPPEESYIKGIGRNLGTLAKEGKLPACLGRDREIDTVLEILYKRFKNNPLIIGAPGTGKTAIVEGLASRIAEGRVPETFKQKEIVELNVGMLVAGTKYRGELETKVKKIIEEAVKNPQLILFIDEFHTIMGAGLTEGGNLDIAEMLKPPLARGEITCIGATTVEDYKKYVEKDPAFERRFYPVKIEELSTAATVEILEHNLPKAQEYYHVRFTPENIAEIVDLTGKYLKKRYFPDKAIDVFEKLASRTSLKGRDSVDSRDIRTMVGEMAGITFSEDWLDEEARLRNMDKWLKERVFGQDEAIDAMCNIIRIAKRRLDLHPDRPDGVFLFTGPTGVGKTCLAKRLAEYMYGSEKKLLRLDMSEYSEPHSVARLTGAPPGYVGYDDVPALSSLVEDNPSAILLLDEIEKAHANVIRLFLQAFDEGKISDSRGRKIYFSDVTVIMTSNALVRKDGGMGFSGRETPKRNADRVIEELSKTFPKEFLNRIDEIVVFNALSPEDIRQILVKNIFPQAQERFRSAGLDISFGDGIVEEVAKDGFHPELGARNLQRAFEKLVLSPLVKRIYDDNIKSGKLALSWNEGKLVVE
jgi:ATP-dependent Clp protease ATP-binding subunit ClpA